MKSKFYVYKFIIRFPRVFNCKERRYGPSGTKQTLDVYCHTMLASWCEGFYAINLMVLMALLVIWVLDLLHTMFILTWFPMYRVTKLQKSRNCHTFQAMSLSKKLFVLLLSQNLDAMFWEDVVKAVLNTKKPIKTKTKAINNGKAKKPKTNKVERIKEYTEDSNDEDPDAISIELEDMLEECEDERQRPMAN